MTLLVPEPTTGAQPGAEEVQQQEHLTLGWLSRAGPRSIALLMLGLTVAGSAVAGAATAIQPMIGVGLAVAVAFALLVMRRLEVGGLLLVTLVPILSGIRRGFPVPSLKLTELLSVGVAGIVFVTIRRVHSRPWTRVEWSLASFVLLYFLLGAFDARDLGVHLAISDYGTLLGPLQFFLVYRCVRLVLPIPILQRRALRALLYASIPTALLGVAQQVHVPAIRGIVATITDSAALNNAVASGYASFARATGPWPQWTLFAGYLSVIIVLGVAVLLEPTVELMPRRRLAAILLIDGIGLLCSAELSAIIGLVIAMALLAWWSRQLGLMMKAFAVVIVVLGFTAGPYIASRLSQEYTKTVGTNGASAVPQTIEFRWQIWTGQYFPAIAERPLDGYGVIQPPIVSWPATESQYVTLMMRGGAPLFASYVVMMGALATAGGSLRRDPQDALRRITGRSVLALVIIMIPMDIVFPYFEDSGLPQALWVLVGIMMATVPGRLPETGLATLPRRVGRLGASGASGTVWRPSLAPAREVVGPGR
jgi:hypothetical protein